MQLPSFLKKYFWDTDFDALNIFAREEYIALRLLEYGDMQAVRWLFTHIPRPVIEKTLQNSRGLSPRTATFWGLILGIKRSKIKCLQKSSRSMQESHWLPSRKAK